MRWSQLLSVHGNALLLSASLAIKLSTVIPSLLSMQATRFLAEPQSDTLPRHVLPREAVRAGPEADGVAINALSSRSSSS